jgi:Tfp pilus assembly protein PilF
VVHFPSRSTRGVGESVAEQPPARSSKSRRRARRLLAIAGTAALLLVGGKAAPHVKTQIRIYLAERAIARGRLDEARDRLVVLISEHPARTGPRLLLAKVTRRQGHLTEAEEILQRAIELGLPVEEARPEHDLIAGAHGR